MMKTLILIALACLLGFLGCGSAAAGEAPPKSVFKFFFGVGLTFAAVALGYIAGTL